MPEPEATRVRDFAAARLKRLVPDEASRGHYEDYFRDFGTILERCRFTNPRKIKRILNRFLLFLHKYEEPGRPRPLTDFPMPNIIRLIAMAEYFPEIFPLLLAEDEVTEEARAMLGTLGTRNFHHEDVLARFGLDVRDALSQLVVMKELFKMDKQDRPQQFPSLREQAQAVYSITRLL
jgi:hypothetical protein